MGKRKKYNSNFDSNLVLCSAKSRYVFVKNLKDLIMSDFKLENLEIPTDLLKEIIIELEKAICFVINLTFIYNAIRLFG
jgi:hypothetical protein